MISLLELFDKHFSLLLLGCLLSGLLLSVLAICAHNFYHKKDNWRMYSFDLTLYSSHEWRISHAYSHHVFPNTINDFEIIAFEKLGTSIDVIVQIRLTYFHNNIMPLISRIPVFRHLVRISVNFILNSYANLHGKVFPRGNELYLNNLILCKKK